MYQKYYTNFLKIENLILKIVEQKTFIETKLLIFYYQLPLCIFNNKNLMINYINYWLQFFAIN